MDKHKIKNRLKVLANKHFSSTTVNKKKVLHTSRQYKAKPCKIKIDLVSHAEEIEKTAYMNYDRADALELIHKFSVSFENYYFKQAMYVF